jgi:hypothetical protein
MDLSPAVTLLTSSPSTGEDRGEGALIFCPLTLTLSRQGEREPVSVHRLTSDIFAGLSLAFTRMLADFRTERLL